ncbi:hypothetical protein DBR32_03350 [Taibaiella sp. KBW10]|nr:hypothetical protein DBR32_03350 [Taibaiella sp. KBW10]
MPIYKELRAEAANDPEPQKQAKNEAKKQEKQLRYLNTTNAGMTAYFDDGTYTSCMHCDFNKSNIESLFKGKPDGTYKVLKDGRIQYSNSNIEEKPRPPKRKFEDGWMLIDYKWNTKVPQQ